MDALHILEETPGQHMHTIKLAILGPRDGAPVPAEEIRAWACTRLPEIPALRWKVLKIPFGLGRPVFVDAGHFDVDAHLDIETLPEPRDDAAFDALVSRFASAQLRRDRPLWELMIVEGLDGDRVALVFKLHHAIMDGQASVRFFEVAFDCDVNVDFGPIPDVPEPVPTRGQLVSFAMRSHRTHYAELPAVARRTAASVRQNRRRKAQGVHPVVNPMAGPSTRFNRVPHPERVYVDVTVPFERVHALRKSTGRTINEVYVALCGGAIRRYLEANGELPEKGLTIAHPISTRKPEEIDNFGNRTSYWYVELGTHIADPLERLEYVKKSLDAAKEWAQGDVELFSVWQDYYLLFGKLTLKGLAVAEKLAKTPLFNTVISNVRGPREISLLGAPVVAVRSMGPITRTLGLNMTAWSYGESFSIGLHSCRDFMPDLRTMADHIEAELEAFEAAVS